VKREDTHSREINSGVKKDEYVHTATFFSLLARRGQKINTNEARKLRFRPYFVRTKGYISPKGFLIDFMKIKDFIAFVYTNELLAKSSFEKIDSSKGATKFFVIVSRKSDPSVQFRFEDKDKGRARTQALKKCFTEGHDDCEVSLIGTTK